MGNNIKWGRGEGEKIYLSGGGEEYKVVGNFVNAW